MERRQIGGAVGAGLFTTGGAAVWQSLNPALDPGTAIALRLIGTFCIVTGLATFAILFITAREAVRKKEVAEARRKERIWSLAQHLTAGMHLANRKLKSEEAYAAWVADEVAWRETLAKEVALVAGVGTAQSIGHVGTAAVSHSHRFNGPHNDALSRHYERMQRVQELITRLEIGGGSRAN